MPPTSTPQQQTIELGEQGNLVLPESILHHLDLHPGEKPILTLEPDGSLRLTVYGFKFRTCKVFTKTSRQELAWVMNSFKNATKNLSQPLPITEVKYTGSLLFLIGENYGVGAEFGCFPA